MAKDYKLKFLGRGSTFNVKEKNTSAYIKCTDTMLLFDCGETVFSSLLEKDILYDVNNLYILITNLQPEHVGSLGSLLMYCQLVKGLKPTVIYPNTLIKHFLQAQGIYEGYELVNTIEDKISCLNISSISHSRSKGRDDISSFSYKITAPSGTFIYYTGSIENGKEIFEIIKDKDCSAVYIDICNVHSSKTTRMSLDDLCHSVSISDKSKVFCMHFDSDQSSIDCIQEGFKVVTI